MRYASFFSVLTVVFLAYSQGCDGSEPQAPQGSQGPAATQPDSQRPWQKPPILSYGNHAHDFLLSRVSQAKGWELDPMTSSNSGEWSIGHNIWVFGPYLELVVVFVDEKPEDLDVENAEIRLDGDQEVINQFVRRLDEGVVAPGVVGPEKVERYHLLVQAAAPLENLSDGMGIRVTLPDGQNKDFTVGPDRAADFLAPSFLPLSFVHPLAESDQDEFKKRMCQSLGESHGFTPQNYIAWVYEDDLALWRREIILECLSEHADRFPHLPDFVLKAMEQFLREERDAARDM